MSSKISFVYSAETISMVSREIRDTQMNARHVVSITVFDDGHQDKKGYSNQWIVVDSMFGGGKLSLVNWNDPSVKISSISAWKTERIR